MFKFLLYKIGQFIVNHLSLKGSYQFASFFSDLQYYFSPRDRRAVRRNLRLIMGSRPDLPQLSREVFRNFGKYLVDFFRMARTVNKEFIQDHVVIRNRQLLDEILKLKKGVILLTAHIGNWELGAVVLSRLGYPFAAIALPHKERPVNDLFNEQRETHGIEIIPSNNAVRRCMEVLKENKIIALLADRDFTKHGEKLNFLGKQAIIPKGAAVFSFRTGAPILPTFLVRTAEGQFELIFDPPIFPPDRVDGQIEDEALRGLMQRHTQVIEEKIRQFPTQWLMFREFWVS